MKFKFEYAKVNEKIFSISRPDIFMCLMGTTYIIDKNEAKYCISNEILNGKITRNENENAIRNAGKATGVNGRVTIKTNFVK